MARGSQTYAAREKYLLFGLAPTWQLWQKSTLTLSEGEQAEHI